uniref:Uncharacterized protein n=1 Tax=Romanomermis culicivorax TaxID=13658 RepID=A0A915INP5_ROMCU
MQVSEESITSHENRKKYRLDFKLKTIAAGKKEGNHPVASCLKISESRIRRCTIGDNETIRIFSQLHLLVHRTTKPHSPNFGRRKPNNIQCYSNGDCLSDCCISNDGMQGTCVGRPLIGQICGLFASSSSTAYDNQNQWKSSRNNVWYLGSNQGFYNLSPYDDSSQSHPTDTSNFPTESNRYDGSLGAASQLASPVSESSAFWNTQGPYNRASLAPSYIHASNYGQQSLSSQQAGVVHSNAVGNSGRGDLQESSIRYSPQNRAVYDFTLQNSYISPRGGFEYPSNIDLSLPYSSGAF